MEPIQLFDISSCDQHLFNFDDVVADVDAVHPAAGAVAIVVLGEAQREGRIVQPSDIEVEQQDAQHILSGLLGLSVPGFVEGIDAAFDI